MAIQAQQRITFQRVQEAQSSYTHIRYSDDGSAFTAASPKEVAKLKDYPTNLLPQILNGWRQGYWSRDNGRMIASQDWICCADLIPVKSGVTYQVIGLEPLHIISYNKDKQLIRKVGEYNTGEQLILQEQEAYIGVSMQGRLEQFSTSWRHVMRLSIYEQPPIDGRNLLLGADTPVTNNKYQVNTYRLTHPPIAGELLTMTLWGAIATDRPHVMIYNSGGWVRVGTLKQIGDNIWQATLNPWYSQSESRIAHDTHIYVYIAPHIITSTSRIDRVKLEYGKVGTPFTLAPEDALMGTTPGKYIGVLTSDSPVASPRFEDYNWQLIKGDKGDPGERGEVGQDGRGVQSMRDYFLLSPRAEGITNNSPGYANTISAPTASQPYLWSYTLISYTDGSQVKTTARIVSVYNAGLNTNLLPISKITPTPSPNPISDDPSLGAVWWYPAYNDSTTLSIDLTRLIEPGEWYTISFAARSKKTKDLSAPGQIIQKFVGMSNEQGVKAYYDGKEITPTSNWYRVIKDPSWELILHTITFRVSGSLASTYGLTLTTHTGYEAIYSHFKLERGMQATGYLPHADDLRGLPGSVAPMLYAAGFWDQSTTYVKDDHTVPYVIYPNTGEGKPYVLIAPRSQGNPPTDQAYWRAMNALKETFVSALVADFGKIGAAVFVGDKMISQMGVDTAGHQTNDYSRYGNGFVPNIEIDYRTGTVYMRKAHIAGTLSGVVGDFRELRGVNAQGRQLGAISLANSLGGLEFSGDIYHQGYANGRGYRFYSSDIWCRGSFGHHASNVMIVNGDHAYFCPQGLNDQAHRVRFNLTKHHASNNRVYYDIPLYGTPVTGAPGFPVDLLIINTPTVFYYRLQAMLGKSIRVANTNDAVSTYIYSRGREEELPGGTITGFTYVGGDNMTPTQGSHVLGAGWMIEAARDNNWM